MSRRRSAVKRKIKPDPKFNEVLVSQLTILLMRKGKKSLAEKIVYNCFDLISKESDEDPLKVFKKALSNVKPSLEVKSRRVGGATYQVTVEIRPGRRTSLGIRWIIQSAKQRKENEMTNRLAREILDAYKNTGLSIKKKEDTHRMAEANRAFAHYRW